MTGVVTAFYLFDVAQEVRLEVLGASLGDRAATADVPAARDRLPRPARGLRRRDRPAHRGDRPVVARRLERQALAHPFDDRVHVQLGPGDLAQQLLGGRPLAE